MWNGTTCGAPPVLPSGAPGPDGRGVRGGGKIWLGRRGAAARRGHRVFALGPAVGPFELAPAPQPGGLEPLREHWTGDLCFDGAFAVRGAERGVRALMGAAGRRHARRILAAGLARLRVRGEGWSAIVRPSGDPLALLSTLEAWWSELCGGTALDRLLEVAVADPQVRVRAAAADALLAWTPTLPDVDVARVCAALASSPLTRSRQRVDAAWRLARTGTEDAQALLGGLIGVGPPALRADLLALLRADRPGPAGVRVLLRMARDPAPRVAVEAIAGLGAAADDPEARTLLLERLVRGPRSVRRAAAEALGHARGAAPEVVRALRYVTGSRAESADVRRAALRALARVARAGPPPGAVSVAPSVGEGALSQTLDLRRTPEATGRRGLGADHRDPPSHAVPDFPLRRRR